MKNIMCRIYQFQFREKQLQSLRVNGCHPVMRMYDIYFIAPDNPGK